MSLPTQADVRSLWAANIATNNTILGYTHLIYNRDLNDASLFEDGNLRYNQQINFMNYIVRRWVISKINGVYEARFLIEVFYTKEADPAGDAYNAVLDCMESVESVVESVLGSRWLGLMDDAYRDPQPAEMGEVVINDVSCWRSKISYTAFKTE